MTIEQGSPYEKIFTLHVVEALFDLDGYMARLQIREKLTSTLTLLSVSSEGESPKLVIDDANGTVTFALSAQDTAAFDFSLARYDLEIYTEHEVDGVMVDDEVFRILEGYVILAKETTR